MEIPKTREQASMRHDCPFAKHAEDDIEAGGPPLALPLMWGATSCHRCLSADACLGYLRHDAGAGARRNGGGAFAYENGPQRFRRKHFRSL